MGFDDFDFNDPMDDLDYFEYMNRIGMYDDDNDEPENDLEDDLLMSGLDPNDLEFMSESERRRTLEDAGLDPDDYDELDFSSYSSRASATSRPNVSPYNTAGRPAANRSSNSNGKWSLLEFIIFVTIFGLVGFAIEAIAGEIIATIVIIIIGIAVLKS